MNAILLHDYPLAVEPGSTPRPLVQKNWSDSLPIDMLLSAVSVLVVAQSSSEIREGLMNNPVRIFSFHIFYMPCISFLLLAVFVASVRVPSCRGHAVGLTRM